MIPESTPAVLRALERAQRYAAGRGAAQGEPLDLLHGLLEEEEGHAAVEAGKLEGKIEELEKVFEGLSARIAELQKQNGQSTH